MSYVSLMPAIGGTTATLTRQPQYRGANSSPPPPTMRATAAATLLLLRANATNAEIGKAGAPSSARVDHELRGALHGGYPVSITSQGEQDFVYQNVCEGRTCRPEPEQHTWVDAPREQLVRGVGFAG